MMFYYIKKFKHFILKSIYSIFCIFPINNKRIFFSNFSGKRYGDNPKYISEKIHEIAPDTEIIWSKAKGYEFETPDYVKVVKNPSISFFYYMTTSKVWVDSHLKRSWMTKRKKQYFFETWHGGLGFKKIENDVENNSNDLKFEKKNATHTANMADVFLSNSEWVENVYRSAFNYSGSIMRFGFPRNDVFFSDNKETVKKVKDYFNIGDKKIILYAPTFRDEFDKSVFNLDFERITRQFEEKFNCECVLLIRLHPLMIEESKTQFKYSDKVINATLYSDAQEILISSDFIITDYSSIIFDFMLMKKPGFLYTPDLDKYKNERGFYSDFSYYPFPHACDAETLNKNIASFDEQHYLDELDRFVEKVGLAENGNATEKVCEVIMKEIGKER